MKRAGNMTPYTVLNPQASSPLVLTCEHASHQVPPEYHNLGLSQEELLRHIGWDIGARAVVETLVEELGALAVCSGYSRLLIDCNRDLQDHDLIVTQSDGTPIPANRSLSPAERERRVQRFYLPYHRAIDRLLGRFKASLLLSIHSFTPVLGNQRRDFDMGVLFDCYETLAQELGQLLFRAGFHTRYNEPYSGQDGLIFSARSHGKRHGLPYLELEINQALISQREEAERAGKEIARVLQSFLGSSLFPAKE